MYIYIVAKKITSSFSIYRNDTMCASKESHACDNLHFIDCRITIAANYEDKRERKVDI